MKVVAEGVEDHDDWRYLSVSGCETAQGYFISRPLPPNELSVWLETWQHRLSSEALVSADHI
jgi:EAL domain-containing protein (putative c-di-GMP-specific phosphodiesterase class I)